MPNDLAKMLELSPADAGAIAPLLGDAAAALAETHIPNEAEIHEMVSGAYKFAKTSSLESEDTDRRLEAAMKNVSSWRQSAEVYLNGASVLLRRKRPMSRYEAKRRVLAAFRAHHPSPGSGRFYFTREKAIEIPADVERAPLAPPPEKGKALLALLQKDPGRDARLLVRALALPQDPRSPEASRIVEALASKPGIAAILLDAMSRPDEYAAGVGGDPRELLLGIRSVLGRLGEAGSERILRAALEAGWLEWIDRPLLEQPLAASLREKLLREFGTRQAPGDNPYRPAEAWFYNVEGAT